MSIDEYYIRLMNEEIDGVISKKNAGKLRTYIESSSDAKRYYEDLRETVRAMDNTMEVDPPPELRQRIFESVYGRSGDGAPARVARPRFAWRTFVPTFAAGLAAGLILFALIWPITGEGPGTGDHGATLGAVDESNGERFDAYGVKGSVLPLFESGSLTLTVKISCETDASVLLDFEEGASFESIRSNEGAAYQMEVDGKSLLLVHQGESEYVIRFRSADTAAVELRVFTDGKTVTALRFATGG